MTTELFVEYTDYEVVPAIDINPMKVMTYTNPIIVCAREGQKIRLNRLKQLGVLPSRVTIVGWWDLSGKQVDDLLEYDGIFVLDPERIGIPAAKKQWEKIIECLRSSTGK